MFGSDWEFYWKARRWTAGATLLVFFLMLITGTITWADLIGDSDPSTRTEATARASSAQPTRLETRTHADGSTYTIRVEDSRPIASPPLDPLLAAGVVGLGIAVLGIGGTLLFFGAGSREPAAPSPTRPDADTTAGFTDEDVRRAMNEAHRAPWE